jgi:serine protease Do
MLVSFGRFLYADTIARTLEKEFIRIVNNVSPSIVEISATRRELLKRPSGFREKVGSGVIIDRKGYIVTTESVVGNSNKIKVTLADGRKLNARLIGVDPATDLAVIKIDADNLSLVVIGNSNNIRSGSWVLTIGQSYGTAPTISFGIINGMEPIPDRHSYYDAMRINARIRPGNSGGAVIDMDGNLVGIITAASAETRIIDFSPLEDKIKEKLPDAQGFWRFKRDEDNSFSMQVPFQGSFFRDDGDAFAIPINFVKGIVDDLIEFGKIERGWLGVLIQPIGDEIAKKFGLGTDDGLIVTQVMDNSPASRVGIQENDVIINFNGKKIKDVTDLTRSVALTKPGSRASITIIRDKKSQAMSIEVGKMPKNL